MRRTKSFLIAFALVAGGRVGLAQSNTFTTVSAGNWGPVVAPDSIAAGFGSNITTQTFSALQSPLPMQLAGVSLQIIDSAKATSGAGLFMVSQGQVNYAIPASSAVGLGAVTLTASNGSKATGGVLISNVAPAIFAANENGKGVAVAEVFYYPPAGNVSYVFTFAGGASGYVTNPISLSPSNNQIFLILYGTGIRRHSPNPVEAIIGGTNVPVTYAGPVAGFVGLDQINIGPLPQSLAGTGKGDVNVSILVDGAPSNTVTVNFQ